MNNLFNSVDEGFLIQAIDYAQQYEHHSHPNPCVGCLIVKNGVVIGKGASQHAGGHHAEVMAINDAINNNQQQHIKGSSVYVTLEPCSHFGKTPPCANALVKNEVARVIIGMVDPHELVKGKGIQILHNDNIKVILNNNDQILNKIKFNLRGFLCSHNNRRAWVRLKVAISIDGAMCLQNGDSKWITGEVARQHGHLFRARSGAIISSINTVLFDDASLNVRLDNIENIRQPLRIVIDTNLKAANDIEGFKHKKILKHQDKCPLLWICGDKQSNKPKIEVISKLVKVISIPLDTEGKHIRLASLLEYIYKLNINEVHVEAGPRLLSSFIEQDLCDEIVMYQAPVLIGNGKRIYDHINLQYLNAAPRFNLHSSIVLGNDICTIFCK
jgi:diaminohydroxyphosphoribosylaminopyrimidine deaminase / 5-amino-6-(5-phosphoribosylamino)uracil reductase